MMMVSISMCIHCRLARVKASIDDGCPFHYFIVSPARMIIILLLAILVAGISGFFFNIKTPDLHTGLLSIDY